MIDVYIPIKGGEGDILLKSSIKDLSSRAFVLRLGRQPFESMRQRKEILNTLSWPHLAQY